MKVIRVSLIRTKGFIQGSRYAGQEFSAANGSHSANSSDALIPAFLAAYTGKSADKISLSRFPSLSSILPNWRVTYDGLIKIPLVKKYFKNIVLSHQYRGSYSVNGYSSYSNWVKLGDGDLDLFLLPRQKRVRLRYLLLLILSLL